MIKLSFEKPSYIVNKEAGVTVCLLVGRITSTGDENTQILLDFVNGFGDLPRRVYGRGKAVLSPADKWDEVTGRRIALAKAKRKAYEQAERKLTKVYMAAEKARQEFCETLTKIGDNKNNAISNLMDLVAKTNK